jgi:hypothetical protein
MFLIKASNNATNVAITLVGKHHILINEKIFILIFGLYILIINVRIGDKLCILINIL